MSFISYPFLVLLAIVLVLYFKTRLRAQNIVLLIASYIFYGWWDWRFLALMAASSLVDFMLAREADEARHPNNPQRRKRAVTLAVISNLTILGFFKYYDFFATSLSAGLESAGVHAPLPLLNVILPVGISFYSFQTMSYTIDVYRGELRSSSSLVDFMLYVSFFPQLVAGPIERGASLLPQIISPRSPTAIAIRTGVELALVGFFKKMVIADNLAPIVDHIFALPHADGLEVLVGVYAYAFRIYCDFSGYTDIARGVARIMGFSLMENFRLPYFATSPADFWRRWHISLSTWLRDYLYRPLGGNRGGTFRTYRNLLLTMLLGGLWHGAMWKYVIWGAYHGVLLIVFRAGNDLRGIKQSFEPNPKSVRFWIAAFAYFQLTCLGWLIFEARSAEHAWAMLSAIPDVHSLAPVMETLARSVQLGAIAVPTYVALLVLIVPLLAVQVRQLFANEMELWTRWRPIPRAVAFVALYYLIVLVSASATYDFVYFQF